MWYSGLPTIQRSRMKTYRDWQLEGRAVTQGAKAEHYLVSPDGTQSRALFREDQTEPIELDTSTAGWTQIVPAAERPTTRRTATAASGPKVIVEYTTETGTLTLWCGSNKHAIQIAKASGFRYDIARHRWFAKRDGITKTLQGLAGNTAEQFNIEAYVDGEHYEPPTNPAARALQIARLAENDPELAARIKATAAQLKATA